MSIIAYVHALRVALSRSSSVLDSPSPAAPPFTTQDSFLAEEGKEPFPDPRPPDAPEDFLQEEDLDREVWLILLFPCFLIRLDGMRIGDAREVRRVRPPSDGEGRRLDGARHRRRSGRPHTHRFPPQLPFIPRGNSTPPLPLKGSGSGGVAVAPCPRGPRRVHTARPPPITTSRTAV